jgi:hypothetical protein
MLVITFLKVLINYQNHKSINLLVECLLLNLDLLVRDRVEEKYIILSCYSNLN